MWRGLQFCIVHPGPRLPGGFPEFFSLEQLRKHLRPFDPLGRENKCLEGRNFCGIFPKSEEFMCRSGSRGDRCVLSMAGGHGDTTTGGFFNNCCSSRGAPGQRNWGHPGREFLPSENEEKEGISWIKLSGMKSALTALCPLEESSQNLKNPEKPLQIPTDPDKRLQNLKNP